MNTTCIHNILFCCFQDESQKIVYERQKAITLRKIHAYYTVISVTPITPPPKKKASTFAPMAVNFRTLEQDIMNIITK